MSNSSRAYVSPEDVEFGDQIEYGRTAESWRKTIMIYCYDILCVPYVMDGV